ncbi:uncharacterized protein F5147DRAFT_653228 [Suillus discolor]|uniref:Uncharacterized protein n=1 Tax=Suillus discolor TaxID=1912936 RepID=A0A9P7F5A7_9AGAM|nr:uncharacterized protein F5147DRAFT_653228 [Suillus discolor]KAG2107708.1 hypothetical protein F5147DRAFT_653228 [Suillus discolor]
MHRAKAAGAKGKAQDEETREDLKGEMGLLLNSINERIIWSLRGQLKLFSQGDGKHSHHNINVASRNCKTSTPFFEHFNFIDALNSFSPLQLFESRNFSSNVIRQDTLWTSNKVICITRLNRERRCLGYSKIYSPNSNVNVFGLLSLRGFYGAVLSKIALCQIRERTLYFTYMPYCN